MLHPQRIIALTFQWRSSLCRRWWLLQSSTPTKCREHLTVGCPATVNMSIAQSQHIRFWKHFRKGRRTTWRARRPGCLLGDSLSCLWQRSCILEVRSTMWLPKKTCRMTTSVDTSAWIGGMSQCSTTKWGGMGNQWLLRWRFSLLWEQAS